MSYLTTGKRATLQTEYQFEVKKWAMVMGVSAPVVKVRQKRAGNYSLQRGICIPPNCEKSSLVHEFAHHVATFLNGKGGHGPEFRAALVQVATVAYGRADRYPWASEYAQVVAWATRHGLIDREERAI